MKTIRMGASALLVVALLGGMLAPALAVGPSGSITHGTVAALQGTPHLWIADAEGVLHWGGDTRALAGRYINWNDRIEVSLAQLQGLQRGDPWLSSGLLKDGDPIYLVKWETDWAEPQLRHIQSIADLELFGIDADNYGDFVLDRSTWEAEYGFAVDDLDESPLPTTAQDPAAQGAPSAVPPGQSRQEDSDDDEDADDDTATATATATGTGDQTATATATATDDGLSLTATGTDDTDDGQLANTVTATATATATATGDFTATDTATATDDGTSVTHTATDDTDLTVTATATDNTGTSS